MFECLSIHSPDCEKGCPGCYLTGRKLGRIRPFSSIAAKVDLICMGYDYGIEQFALGVNEIGGHTEGYFHHVIAVAQEARYLVGERPIFRLTTSEINTNLSINYDRLLTVFDEIYLSVDTYRYPLHYEWKVNAAVNMLKGYRIQAKSDTKICLAILMTPAQAKTLWKTIAESVEHVDEIYLISMRGVDIGPQGMNDITTGLSKAMMVVNQMGVHEKIAFDHCDVMSINGQKCGQRGLLDISTDGGVRTCVYSQKPDFYLSRRWKSELRGFIDSILAGNAPEAYKYKEIECNKCPILWKKEDTAGVRFYGENTEKTFPTKNDKGKVKIRS